LGDIFTVANAGDDEETANLLLDGADGALDDAVFILVPGGLFVLVFGYPERDHVPDAERLNCGVLLDDLVDREL